MRKKKHRRHEGETWIDEWVQEPREREKPGIRSRGGGESLGERIHSWRRRWWWWRRRDKTIAIVATAVFFRCVVATLRCSLALPLSQPVLIPLSEQRVNTPARNVETLEPGLTSDRIKVYLWLLALIICVAHHFVTHEYVKAARIEILGFLHFLFSYVRYLSRL